MMKYTAFFLFALLLLGSSCNNGGHSGVKNNDSASAKQKQKPAQPGARPASALDTAAYNRLMAHMTNGDTSGLWPVKHEYPREGAILPFKRVVSYYGNLYSKQMGILGELPKDSMLRRLQLEVEKWTKADSVMPAIPALHYIAVTAQGAPGAGGKYRLRMPFHQIDTVLSWAKEINALVFIDIQVGLSTLQQELPEFEKYLSLPNVHFGIDPEFSMKTGSRPGSVIGTFDAADINYVTDYLAEIVRKHNLPPKILIIHRFTQGMVTNYKNITLKPEVQIVMDMDGWGEAERKVNTYSMFIHPEPVQFTGFKIFYKNDTKKVGRPREMQPADLLKLQPVPVYIQYQ
jgi:hypothetical protein